MNYDYRTLAALYLDAALYRVKLDHQFKQNGRWKYGSLVEVIRTIQDQTRRFKERDAVISTFLLIQRLVEVGCDYLRQNPDKGNFNELSRQVDAAMDEARLAFQKGDKDGVSILRQSVEHIAADLAQIHEFVATRAP